MEKNNLKKSLVIGLVIIISGAATLPSIEGTDQKLKINTTQNHTGKTYYVDDDAPPEWYNETNFYTIYQAQIKAINGDKIFIYSGTYHKVIIEKEIILEGENSTATFIPESCYILADHVTLKNCTLDALFIEGNYVEITRNNINGDIDVGGSDAVITHNQCNSEIELYGDNNIVSYNNIFTDEQALIVYSNNNLISHNHFKGKLFKTRLGIQIGFYIENNIIQYNEFKNCHSGIIDPNGRTNNISYNNFIFTRKPIKYRVQFNRFYENFSEFLLDVNTYHHNYYNIPYPIPKLVFGTIRIGYTIIRFPFALLDKNPATEPNEI